ncbi:hypothetical protein [Prosthecobacter sp.]|uniref:hypothetical protein n=1 Tax=Prosthecobacter sp. TaxID=1965333 RepID=UPI0037849E1A
MWHLAGLPEWTCHPHQGTYGTPMVNDLTEPLKKRVGGSLSRLPPLQRLEMLRRNALLLRGGKWSPPPDDGTLVRKVVGLAR